MNFKVGDRVAVYGDIIPKCFGTRFTGSVTRGLCDYAYGLGITSDIDGKEYYVHPKQCRRLVKKKRRRIWVNLLQDKFSIWERLQSDGWSEFIEVKKK